MTTRGASRIQRSVQASKLFVKLNYYDDVELIATNTSTYTEYIFAQNGIFDPDVSSSGHQPRGRDQYAALYDQYMVHGMKFKITLRPSTNEGTSTTASPMVWGAFCGPDFISSQFNNITDVMEYPKNKYLIRKPLIQRASSLAAWYSGSYSNPWNYMIKGYYSTRAMKKYYGYADYSNTPSQNWPADWSAAVGSNPPSTNYFVIWVAALSENGVVENLPRMQAQVELQYFVEFFLPNYPSVS